MFLVCLHLYIYVHLKRVKAAFFVVFSYFLFCLRLEVFSKPDTVVCEQTQFMAGSLPTIIPNPHHTNHNNNYCLLPAVASTTSEKYSTQQVQSQTNQRNYKPVAEGQNYKQYKLKI